MHNARMNFDELINQGWARHDKETAALSADLEQHAGLATDAAKAVAFVALSNHTIGYHGKDWPRARKLAERIAGQIKVEPAASSMFGNLAVARFMDGDAAGSLAAECRSVELAESPLSPMVRTRILIASELTDSGRIDEGAKVYIAALALARSRPEKLGCDRAIGVTSNNLASGLLEKKNRSPEETALMLTAAHASREFWMKSGGTWVNEERAEYLLALIHNDLKQPDKALQHARHGLEVIAAGGDEKVDEAFLNLAAAHAHKLGRDETGYAKSLARADELAAAFDDAGLKEWYAGERTKVAG